MINFLEYYKDKNHIFGECMSLSNIQYMYVNIPKNASSWTRNNLLRYNWEFYNYHTDDLYHKHAIIVLRDPIERWLSGIAEYMYLYHRNIDPAHFSKSFFNLVFDRIAFDDHTEKQVLFFNELNLNNCTFFYCDVKYKEYIRNFISKKIGNTYFFSTLHEHVTNESLERKKFRQIFSKALHENSKYLINLKKYFNDDYKLINSITFYAG